MGLFFWASMFASFLFIVYSIGQIGNLIGWMLSSAPVELLTESDKFFLEYILPYSCLSFCVLLFFMFTDRDPITG